MLTKLNLGCGYRYNKEFVNCDSNTKVKADFYFDLESPNWPLPSNHFEYVVLSHVLEHLGKGYFTTIQELYRVCKDNALIEIKVPHHLCWTFHNDPTHKRPITLGGLQMFDLSYEKNELAVQLGVNFRIIESTYLSSRLPVKNQYFFVDNHFNTIQELMVIMNAIKSSDKDSWVQQNTDRDAWAQQILRDLSKKYKVDNKWAR